MFSLKRIILFFFVLFLLSACGTVPKEQIVYRSVAVHVPDYLIDDCPSVKPPDVTSYVEASWDKKEEILTSKLSEQYSLTQTCNIRLTKGRELQKEQLLIIQDKGVN